MPRTLPPALSLMLALVAASPAAAATGGASVPSNSGGADTGDALPSGGQSPGGHRPRRPRGPVLTRFVLHRSRLFLYGPPVRVELRFTARSRHVGAKLVLRRPGERRVAFVLPLGQVRRRTTVSVPLTGRVDGVLLQGRYDLSVSARDGRGRRLRRKPGVPRTRQLRVFGHRFPLIGSYSFGGSDARFGAARHGHRHQGQDVIADAGTPVVAPRGGTITVMSYQAGGAGNYVVLDGAGENRDYAFMHLRSGTVRVREGQRVRTGQRIADVGATGEASGPHLHFEVWEGGGWRSGGHPVDPLPLLRAWGRY